MKSKILASTKLLAAIVSLAQIAQADTTGQTFIPVENLDPSVRQEVGAKVSELTEGVEIDWDNVAVGLNENGEICFRSPTEVQCNSVAGTFSCWAARIRKVPDNQ